MHGDELKISSDLERQLVERDVPELRGGSLRRLQGSGSSNVLFSLGPEHLVRLPRQPGGGQSIETEARWVPRLAPALPVPTPEAVAIGRPGFGYPERWSVTRWIEGRPPATPQPTGRAADNLARDLAEFLATLHGLEVPPEAACDPSLRSYRAGPLSDIDADIRQYLERCRDLTDLPLDLDACVDLWTESVALPTPLEQAPRWVHSDFLAENLLVHDDRLAAVLDFGALAVGDPSVDLVVAWEVLGPQERDSFRAGLGIDDDTWRRGRAWALAIAIMTFPYYWTSLPGRCAARLAMANAVLKDHR